MLNSESPGRDRPVEQPGGFDDVVLQAVDPHRDRLTDRYGVDVVRIVVEVARDGEPVQMSLLDHGSQLLRREPLRLDATDAAGGPVIHFAPQAVRGDVVVPAWAGEPEVGPGVQDPRSHLLAPLDALPDLEHVVRIHGAGRKGRGHPVGQIDQRVVMALVDPALADQRHAVVRVEVEEAGKDRIVIVEVDDLCILRIATGETGADLDEAALADDDARVRLERIRNPVEQAATPQDRLGSLVRVGHGAADPREAEHTGQDDGVDPEDGCERLPCHGWPPFRQ